MRNRFIATTIIFFAACMAVCAQGTCTINGKIDDYRMADGKAIKKLYLIHTDEYGRNTKVAEAKVKKGTYSFKHQVQENEPVMLYSITGFDDNNCIELFVEPGTVTVNTEKATKPCQSKVKGTPTNDTFDEYKSMLQEYDTSKAVELIKRESERIKFLIDHNSSPMTPLEMERSLMPYLSEVYAEQMVKSIAMELHTHPYYVSFRNAMLARTLKVGNEIPDVAFTEPNGTTRRMTDYRGKYILLDFWASTCESSMAQRETLKELYGIIKDKQEQFIIVSLSLDKNMDDWKNAIQSKGFGLDGWIHGCDNTGKTISFFGAEETPRMILIDPDGRAISLDMSINEVIERTEQILSGDLYYLDQEK